MINKIENNHGHKVIISESKRFICLTVVCSNHWSLSWETLQGIKDKYFPKIDFIEVYPRKDEVINKANERHLIHQKRVLIPKLGDLEEEAEITIIE